MANWPPTQPDGQAAPQNPSSANLDSSTPTMSSENSDTVIIDKPDSKSEKTQIPTDAQARPPPLTRQSTTGIKKCWICICDATEDDPDNPPVWRSPCTCNLTAHEDCLLDWVADLENPRNRRRRPQPAKILCPQCKSEIKIARPKNYIVEAVKATERGLSRLVLPGLGFTIAGTIWTGAVVHGMVSVWLVFGPEDAIDLWRNHLHNIGELAAHGLIPLSLIFSRTRYADYILPGGTIFLVASQLRERFEIDWTIWPPLPSTVFACLPAIGKGYKWCYEKAFGELNRKWIAEVQPRHSERAEDNVEGDMEDAVEQAAEGNGGLAIEIDINLGGGVVEEEPVQAEAAGENNPDGQQQAAEQQPNAENDDQNNNNNNNNNNGGNVHPILGPRGDELVEGTASLGLKVVGALAFPAISAGMGMLISLVIPPAWMTNSNYMNGRPGLLRNRWGRSVVGGCLFVVLKDAVVLYCRWKLAQAHRQRRIVDYDKVKKEYVYNS